MTGSVKNSIRLLVIVPVLGSKVNIKSFVFRIHLPLWWTSERHKVDDQQLKPKNQ